MLSTPCLISHVHMGTEPVNTPPPPPPHTLTNEPMKKTYESHERGENEEKENKKGRD